MGQTFIAGDQEFQTILQGATKDLDPYLSGARVVYTANDVLTRLTRTTLYPEDLLLLDSQIISNRTDFKTYGGAALELLTELRKRGIYISTILLTYKGQQVTGFDDFCIPENNAIALPIEKLSVSGIFAAFSEMVRRRSPVPKAQPQPIWNMIEIEVNTTSGETTSVTCYLKKSGEPRLEWSSKVINYSLSLTAEEFADGDSPLEWGGKTRWVTKLRARGADLFSRLVIEMIGKGLFEHIEKAAGGLSKLAFRFRVINPTLYPVPFEACVRVPQTNGPFVLLSAPVARFVKAPELNVVSSDSKLPRPTRLLFIRSQVGEHLGGSARDELSLPIEDAAGITSTRTFTFRPLRNIDSEWADLQKLQTKLGKDVLEIDLLDLSKEPSPREALEAAIVKGKFEILHFSGHSFSLRDQKLQIRTFLVVPGAEPGRAAWMTVDEFAKLAGQAEAWLVYLSSCQGSSTQGVANLVSHGVPHVIGFRWNVEDAAAAEFAGVFYKSLFQESQWISAAFCAACKAARSAFIDEGTNPIWVSPILVTQPDNWAA